MSTTTITDMNKAWSKTDKAAIDRTVEGVEKKTGAKVIWHAGANYQAGKVAGKVAIRVWKGFIEVRADLAPKSKAWTLNADGKFAHLKFSTLPVRFGGTAKPAAKKTPAKKAAAKKATAKKAATPAPAPVVEAPAEDTAVEAAV